MKHLSAETLQKLNSGNFEFVKCFIITLKDSSKLYFTENSEDLIIDNNIYKSSLGVEENKIETYNNITESKQEIMGFLNNSEIDENDIILGKFNGAVVETFLIDKNDLSGEKICLNKGFFSNITLVDGKFFVEIVGISSILNKPVCETYSPLCRCCFCDKRCGLDKNNYCFSASITSINSDISFYSAELLDFEDNYFKYGIITFTTGLNINTSIVVKDFISSTVILEHKPQHSLTVGDTFKIICGCDKTLKTCYNKFHNSINFRGEPNIPREEKVYRFY